MIKLHCVWYRSFVEERSKRERKWVERVDFPSLIQQRINWKEKKKKDVGPTAFLCFSQMGRKSAMFFALSIVFPVHDLCSSLPLLSHPFPHCFSASKNVNRSKVQTHLILPLKRDREEMSDNPL